MNKLNKIKNKIGEVNIIAWDVGANSGMYGKLGKNLIKGEGDFETLLKEYKKKITHAKDKSKRLTLLFYLDAHGYGRTIRILSIYKGRVIEATKMLWKGEVSTMYQHESNLFRTVFGNRGIVERKEKKKQSEKLFIEIHGKDKNKKNDICDAFILLLGWALTI